MKPKLTVIEGDERSLDEKIDHIAVQLADALIREWDDLSVSEKVNAFKAISGYRLNKKKTEILPITSRSAFEAYSKNVSEAEEDGE